MELRRSDVASVWLGAGFLIAMGGAALLARYPNDVSAKLTVGLATQVLWVCLAFGIALLLGAARPAQRLGLGPGRLGVPSLVLLVAGFAVFSNGLNALLIWIDVRDTGTLAELDATVAQAQTRAPTFSLALLALGLAPGVGEEILFRGLLQRGLVPRIGALAGIVAAAAVFALAHLDPVHSSVALLLGVYLGSVAHLAGSVRASIACHVVNNTLGLLAPLLGLGHIRASALLVIPGLLGVGLVPLAWVYRRAGTPPGEKEAPGSPEG